MNSQGRTNEDWDAERDLIWRKKFPESESKDLNLNVGHQEGSVDAEDLFEEEIRKI